MLTIEERIEQIEKRNERVELDKAWETSWTRRALLAGFTKRRRFSEVSRISLVCGSKH